ncbi:MAG: 4a-hydroxytetrahydrobiopterin dehydratase [Candidatus Aenigmarchaeota archaeon]|nr:4a-hydroxytetrahydrobiopterin dehydratase [Candidatus Aenigmarchaeota archaeon]
MRLAKQAVIRELKGLKGWTLDGKEIRKEFRFREFADSVEFANKVFYLAEEKDHHPDILIRYNKVMLTLSTHSEGGVTEKDIILAREIERI